MDATRKNTSVFPHGHIDRSTWKCVRLGDFESHRNNTCARSLMTSDFGSIHNIHYGDILVKYNEVVSLLHHNVDYLTVEGETHSPKDYVCDGDVIIADTAEDETVGKTVEIQDVGNRKVVAGLHTFLYRPPPNMFVRGWLGYWMNSSAYHSQLFQYMTGTKVLSLTRASIAATVVQYPFKELQRQIVTALDSIQTQIKATQKLIAKYEAIKKATVNLLLKQKADWRQISLGDIGDVLMCKRILKNQTTETGDVPFYKIGTFGRTPDSFISRSLFKDFKARFSYPQKGDVLLSAAGTIGRTVVFNGEDAYFQDSNIVWIDNDERAVTNRFLNVLYGQMNWQTENGGTVSRLYNANIRNTKIKIPSLSEQKRIVAILDSIDGTINGLKSQLAKAQDVKQGMMSYFFG